MSHHAAAPAVDPCEAVQNKEPSLKTRPSACQVKLLHA